MTTQELWEKWLRTKALNLSPTTQALYEGHVRVHLNPAFGGRLIRGITEDDILAYVNEKRKILHRNTVARQLSMLHQAFVYAMARGYTNHDPCVNVRLSTRIEPAATVLDEDQVRVFLREAWRSRYYPLYLTAICSGLRRGELMGLRWQDVGWKSGTLTVLETYVHIPGTNTWITKEPKSRSSRRRITVPTAVLDALRPMYEHRTAQQVRVFTNPNGHPWSVRYIVARDMRKICLRTGLPRLRLHDLRHTYATLRLAMRHSPRSVQESLGHASVAFTLAIYAHVLPSDGASAAQELQARLFPSSPAVDVPEG